MKKLLLVCGSRAQAEHLHAVARTLPDHRAVFATPYGGRWIELLKSLGLLEWTSLGHARARPCLAYLREHHLPCEPQGMLEDFHVAVVPPGRVWAPNLVGKRVVQLDSARLDPAEVRALAARIRASTHAPLAEAPGLAPSAPLGEAT